MRMRKTEADAKRQLVLEAARANPDLNSMELAERCGANASNVRRILTDDQIGKRGKPKPKKTDGRFARKTCPYCGKRMRAAGYGAHMKVRKETGRCPTGKPKRKWTPRKVSRYVRDWNRIQKQEGENWSMLQDVEGMS